MNYEPALPARGRVNNHENSSTERPTLSGSPSCRTCVHWLSSHRVEDEEAQCEVVEEYIKTARRSCGPIFTRAEFYCGEYVQNPL